MSIFISGPSGLEVGGADLTWKTGRHVSATSSSVCDFVMWAGVGGAVGGEAPPRPPLFFLGFWSGGRGGGGWGGGLTGAGAGPREAGRSRTRRGSAGGGWWQDAGSRSTAA